MKDVDEAPTPSLPSSAPVVAPDQSLSQEEVMAVDDVEPIPEKMQEKEKEAAPLRQLPPPTAPQRSPSPVPASHPQPAQLHSPPTPQERRSPTPALSPFGGDNLQDGDKDTSMEDLDSDTFRRSPPPPPVFKREDLLASTWESFDEPHNRLSAALFDSFRERDDQRKSKAISLRQEYKALNSDWREHVKRLDEIRDRIVLRRANRSDTAPQTPSIDSAGMPYYPEPSTPGPSSLGLGGGRSNRRGVGLNAAFGYGDAVRSEAEFLEILASLETADLRDPDVRAARTAAVVPDMVLDPSERRFVLDTNFDDDRTRVVDPVETYGVHAPLDVWTEAEVETFCKRYAQHPKQFGKIANELADKSTAQCVLFYYRMKNTIDFRSLSERRGRDGRGGGGGGGGRKKTKKRPEEQRGGKGSSLLANLKKPARITDNKRGGKEKEKGMERGETEEDRMDEDEHNSTPNNSSALPSPMLSRANLPPIVERPLPPPTSASSATTFIPSQHHSSLASRPPPPPQSNGFHPHTASPYASNPSSSALLSSSAVASLAPLSAATAIARKTPKLSNADLPASEGMLEAAAVLGALGGPLGPSPAPAEDGKRVQRAAARKVRMDLDDEVDSPPLGGRGERVVVLQPELPFGELLLPGLGERGGGGGGGGGQGGEEKQPKKRSNTSSYWTVAERTEIVRLVGVYGKDWKAIAEGLGNKTWVQCRNVRFLPLCPSTSSSTDRFPSTPTVVPE